MKNISKIRGGLVGIGAAAALLASTSAMAADYTLRIQTHYAPDETSGKLVEQFVDDVETMSGGRLTIEMFYASSVVKPVETFDAAANGILDGDMTGGAYQTGKNPAFQFVGDIMGGYDTPWQQYAWFYFGGGSEAANKLYNQYDMHLIGWWVHGQESISSSRPIAGPDDLKEWRFRSTPGLETEIFAELGATPVVMEFADVSEAMKSGHIDGADYSGLANNMSIVMYDLVSHATYPGFHSMPSNHLAIRKDAWDSLPEDLQRIVDVALQKLAFQTAMTFEVKNSEAAAALREQGVILYDWSAKDRAKFRAAAQAAWQRWADKTPEARALVDSHVGFLIKLGLINPTD